MLLASLICLIFGTIASCSILYFLVPILKKRVLDSPNERSSHIVPTPRGGGLSFVLISVFTSLVLFCYTYQKLNILPLVCLPLALVGFFDDKYSSSALLRYVVQVITSIALIYLLNNPLIAWYQNSFYLLMILFLILILVTAIINFVNFMDGLDGLVAGCMFVILATSSLQTGSLSLWVLTGSLFGFLLWNWSPAQVFMGDIGSTFLGSILAGLILFQPSLTSSLSLLLVSTPLLADPFFCIIKRILRRQPIFKPHRLHLYQRLHQSGWTHAQVSSLYIFCTLILAITHYFFGLPWVFLVSFLIVVQGFLIDKYIAAPFSSVSK